MSGYQINEEDIEKALRQLLRDDPENANREYAIQMLEGMHAFAKGAAASDPKTLEELEKALEADEVDSKDESSQPGDKNQDSRADETQEFG